MRVLRNTTHAALHRAGAVNVVSIGPGEFEVTPDINVSLLPSIELLVDKEKKILELVGERKRAIGSLPPVIVAGKQYPANSEYREVVSNLSRRSAAGRPIPASLRGADGSAAALTAAILTQIDDAISAAVQAQWDKYWQKYDQVQAAATVDQVNAVVW